MFWKWRAARRNPGGFLYASAVSGKTKRGIRANIGATVFTDSTDSGEATPSLGQKCTKHLQLGGCKGDAEATPNSSESLLMSSHAFNPFNCLTPKFRAVSRSSCRSTFQHLTRKLSNTGVSHCRGSLHSMKMGRNRFGNPGKCFKMNGTSSAGV